MSPKEKAIELYWKFRNEMPVLTANYRAKKQALICIEEIIEVIKPHLDITYWSQVKQELNKL